METYKQGTRIQNYRLNCVLGAGGFGTIYHATDENNQREVAIKIIHSNYAQKKQFIDQFELEAQILTQLGHEHIVSFYDYGCFSDGAYLAMEWIQGDNLHIYLKENTLDYADVIHLFNQLASALDYIHSHSIVHRDIKPSNILIDNHKNVFLVDFGIAVDLKVQTEVDIPSFILGSPGYLAPEQIVNNHITPQGDIYSLGIILYELLAHEHPFQADSTQKILQMQLLNPLPSLRMICPDLPVNVDLILWKATAKQPEERYTDALGFARAVKDILGSFTDKSSANPPKYLHSSGNSTEIIDVTVCAKHFETTW